MKATRYRQRPRITDALAPPAVRHDVLMVPEPTHLAPKRLHGGIALEAEARLLFDAARVEVRGRPGPACAIILERHTVETLAIQPPASREVLEPAPPVEFKPSPVRIDVVGPVLEGMRRAIAKAFAIPPIVLDGRGAKLRPVAPAHSVAVAVLFDIAASHQGGHSRNGRLIAGALGVPFPITMPNLAKRALEEGLEPRLVWPWWAAAPIDMAEALRLIARQNAPESELCEGGCGKLRVECLSCVPD